MTKPISRWNEVKELAERNGFELRQERGRYKIYMRNIEIFSGLTLHATEKFIKEGV